jgi:molybdate transport system substrate-binding protein
MTRPLRAFSSELQARVLGAAGLLAIGMGACGHPTPARSPAEDGRLEGSITVFAAVSLTEAFREAGARFEEANPGTKVAFQFGASTTLAVQISEGAPADVFAAADSAQMKVVTDAGAAINPAVFASNTPVVVAPRRSSVVASFADLAVPGVKLVLTPAAVPIGRYARAILARATGPGGISTDFSARVLANVRSEEASVRAVLVKVQLGEADAGFVYRTDAAAAGDDVRVVPIPAAYTVIAEYPIATLDASRNPELASAFVAFIRSAAGQAILEKHGFTKP